MNGAALVFFGLACFALGAIFCLAVVAVVRHRTVDEDDYDDYIDDDVDADELLAEL